MNKIIWKSPSGEIAQTVIVSDQDPREHAELLMERKNIPEGWVPVIFGECELPDFLSFSDLRIDDQSLIVYADMESSRKTTADRLRQEREPLLRELDIEFQRAMEIGGDTSEIVAEKNRLRDITELVNQCDSLAELRLLSVEGK